MEVAENVRRSVINQKNIMKNQSQKQYVEKILLNHGEISRNHCLQERITRLSAIIQSLEESGWEFNPHYRKENGGRNFYYTATKMPYRKVEYRVEGGPIIIKHELTPTK